MLSYQHLLKIYTCSSQMLHSEVYKCVPLNYIIIGLLAYFMIATKLLPAPMKTCCQLDSRNKPQWNFNQNATSFFQDNAYLTSANRWPFYSSLSELRLDINSICGCNISRGFKIETCIILSIDEMSKQKRLTVSFSDSLSIIFQKNLQSITFQK